MNVILKTSLFIFINLILFNNVFAKNLCENFGDEISNISGIYDLLNPPSYSQENPYEINNFKDSSERIENFLENEPILINQTLKINSINFIDELKSEFELNFEIISWWYDKRLNYIYEKIFSNNINPSWLIENNLPMLKSMIYEFYKEMYDSDKKNEITEDEINLALTYMVDFMDEYNISDSEYESLKLISEENAKAFNNIYKNSKDEFDEKKLYFLFLLINIVFLDEVVQKDLVQSILYEDDITYACEFRGDYYEQIYPKVWLFNSNILNKTSDDLINQNKELIYYIGNNELFNLSHSLSNTLTLKTNFNFRSFPFDKQQLEIILFNDWQQIIQDIDPKFSPIDNEFELEFDISNTFLYEWKFSPTDYEYFYDDNNNLNLKLNIERDSSYYLYKILSPIILILVVCWSVLFISPLQLESRLTVSIVCFLTLIAFNFVIDENLPKLGYLTLVDYFVLLAYLFSSLPTIISIFEYKISGNQHLSIKVNKFFRYSGLPLFLIIVFILFKSISSNNSENINSLLKAITL